MPAQLAFKLKPKPGHGGKRRGAGRKNLRGIKAHLKRPALETRHPVHVTLKLRPGLPSLRKKEVFACLRHAVRKARVNRLHVAHFAILSNHVHFILEPRESSLARVIQSLCISFAKKLNRIIKGKGSVFHGRYDLHVLKTPTQVRNALAYVLSNEDRHRSNGKQDKRIRIQIDPFSSALLFDGWRKLFKAPLGIERTHWNENSLREWLGEILSPPRTWLLKTGWARAS